MDAARGSARRVFVGSQDNNAICSDTLGVGPAAWTNAGALPAAGVLDAFSFQFAPSDPNVAYAKSPDPEEYAVTASAGSALACGQVAWVLKTPTRVNGSSLVPPSYWSRNSLAVHALDSKRLYLALLNRYGRGFWVFEWGANLPACSR